MAAPSERLDNANPIIIALPNEILSAMLGDLPLATLASVAAVSRRFNAVAERLLYASVVITDVLSESTDEPAKTLRWCDAIRRRPHLLDTTRRVQVRWLSPLAQTRSRDRLDDACAQLAAVLPLLVCLEHLDLYLGPANLTMADQHSDRYGPAVPPPPPPPPSMHAIERVIHGCRFPLLRHCSLGADWVKGVQAYGGTLAAFLSSVPALRHLKLQDHRDASLELPADALPALSWFRGSADTAASLLPGRPVQYLSLIGQDADVNRENLRRMTQTTAPLRYLDLSSMSVRPVVLRNISTHLATVHVLRIKLALRHTLHYAFSGIRLLAVLSPVLNAFNQLKFLDLSPTDVGGVGRADSREESALCADWSRACPSLRRVIFPSDTEWVLGEEGWFFVSE